MKKVFCLILTLLFIVVLGVVSFAVDDPELIFESSYNADTNQVSVLVFVENPGAVSSADLRMGYDQNVYEFTESEDNQTISDMMVMSGQAVIKDGLVCTSLLFTDACEESFLTDNRLYVTTFIFTPLTEDYDINDFCLWAYSFEVDDNDIAKSIDYIGNGSLKDGKAAPVTVADIGDSSSDQNTLNDKWYVYVIAVVAGVAIVAGVAVFAVKSGDNEENKDKKNDSASDKNT